MSSIIKNFRVIEGHALVEEKTLPQSQILENKVLEEAYEKCDYIIDKANKKAEGIVDSAYKEYDDKLNQAYENAKIIYEENKEKGYKEGFNLGKKEGSDKGYKEGYEKGEKEAQKIIDEALNLKSNYIDMKNNLLRESEKELINLVITIYEKILNKKVEDDNDLIVSMVVNNIDGLEIKDKLTIIVSEGDYECINKHKNMILAKATLIDEVDIRISSDMDKGDCLLETSKGNIDISLGKQLEEMKEYILSILYNG